MRRAALAIWVLLLLAGCGPTPTPPEDDDRAFAERVDSVTVNLLTAIERHDRESFTRDMDATMQQAFADEASFEEMYQFLMGKIGPYISHRVVQVDRQGGMRLVVYDARFEQEEHVLVRVVFTDADPPQVSGLWFDSPKLRQP